METKLAVVVLKGRVELVGPMDPAAIDDHHDLFAGFTEDRHHLMDILTQLLGIKVGHDFIEDFGGPILDGANDAEQHAAGDAAPGAILPPRLAFAGFLAFDLALAQWPYREASTLGGVPPARAGQGKAPQDGFVCIEQNDLPTASLVLEGSKFQSPISEVSGVGLQATGGTIVAYPFFLMHSAHFRARDGLQFGRRTQSPVHGSSIASRSSRAQGGLDRRDD
jgi:hypothetical protein